LLFHSSVTRLNPKKFVLPVIVRPLDVELATRPVATVLCPLRADVVAVGNCRQCESFRFEQQTAHGKLVVACVPPTGHGAAPRGDVRHVVRMPLVCAAADTSVQQLIPYIALQQPWDIVPVLDWNAAPIGVLINGALKRLVEDGLDPQTKVTAVMQRKFAVASPCMSLSDAARMCSNGPVRDLIVANADGTFLGIVSEAKLPTARALDSAVTIAG
jgi:CBS domain-containing protein